MHISLSSWSQYFEEAPEIPEGGSLSICSKKNVPGLRKCWFLEMLVMVIKIH